MYTMKKILSAFLVLITVLSLFPIYAFALVEPDGETVELIEIENVNTRLLAGQPPVFTATLSEESAKTVELSDEMWVPARWDASGGADSYFNSLIRKSNPNSPLPEKDNTYFYAAILNPKEGYRFTKETKVKINGKDYLTLFRYNYCYQEQNPLKGSPVVSYIMNQRAVDEVIETISINKFNYNLIESTVPQASFELDKSLKNKVTIKSAVWEDKDGNSAIKIIGGQTYYYHITLEIADIENYTFFDNANTDIKSGYTNSSVIETRITKPIYQLFSDYLYAIYSGQTLPEYEEDILSIIDIPSAEIRIPVTAKKKSLLWWQKIDGNWYYYNSKGEKATGWRKLKGNWYLFNSNGIMQTGWKKDNGKWYYLGSNGAMYRYYRTIGSKRYYFNSSGAMVTGWVRFIKTNEWHYFNPDGSMRTDSLTYKNKVYHFNSFGVCINP